MSWVAVWLLTIWLVVAGAIILVGILACFTALCVGIGEWAYWRRYRRLQREAVASGMRDDYLNVDRWERRQMGLRQGID